MPDEQILTFWCFNSNTLPKHTYHRPLYRAGDISKLNTFELFYMDTTGRKTKHPDFAVTDQKAADAHSQCRISWRRICASVVIVAGLTSVSVTEAREPGDSAVITFKQSRWQLNPSLGDNRAQLDSLTEFMSRYGGNDSVYTLRSVRVVGAASPEGSVSINEQLSRRRAAGIFDYFSKLEPMPDSVTSFEFLGRDWQGLRKLVEADTRVPYRSEVLGILSDVKNDSTIDSKTSNAMLSHLRAIHGGVPYSYLYTNIFPRLRMSKLYVEYTERPHTVLTHDTIVEPIAPLDTIVEEVEIVSYGEVKQCRPFYMDIKTNLLYDALAIPAIGVDFYVGKNWSIGANWMYGWWDNDSRHRYWRAYGGDVNVRRWFGRRAEEKPLTGHHLGLYAGAVTYDFEFGGKGYMGGLPHRSLWDRCNFMGGIEYGYTLPVSRRINFDFTIGLGYLGGKYLEYVPKDNHYVWQSTKRLNWVGPTKIEVSLVWLLGCDNYNRKGGDK